VRAVLQRVRSAQVEVAGEVVGRVGPGILALVAIHRQDTAKAVPWLADKIAGMRIFEDAAGKMNLAVGDAGGGILLVSQFTLYGDCTTGKRPSFSDAARPDVAIPLYEALIAALRDKGISVATGIFGADMQVTLVNDGPVTLIVDSPRLSDSLGHE
jgi:D-aminoacyl-tRNA deacylase